MDDTPIPKELLTYHSSANIQLWAPVRSEVYTLSYYQTNRLRIILYTIWKYLRCWVVYHLRIISSRLMTPYFNDAIIYDCKQFSISAIIISILDLRNRKVKNCHPRNISQCLLYIKSSAIFRPQIVNSHNLIINVNINHCGADIYGNQCIGSIALAPMLI